MVEVRRAAELDASVPSARARTDSVVGQVARYPINEGEQVLSSKLVDTTSTSNDALAYILEPGKRGMAITFDEVIGAGGLVLPGDHVDMLWVPFHGAPAFILLSDIEVTAVRPDDRRRRAGGAGLCTRTKRRRSAARRSHTDVGRGATAGRRQRHAAAHARADDDASSALRISRTSYGGEIRLAVRSFGDTAPLAAERADVPADRSLQAVQP